jgi:hypothetical protein
MHASEKRSTLRCMREEVIELPDRLKGLTHNERMLLWQAMTIDILSEMATDHDDRVVTCLLWDHDRGMYRTDVGCIGALPVYSFWGERVPRP